VPAGLIPRRLSSKARYCQVIGCAGYLQVRIARHGDDPHLRIAPAERLDGLEAVALGHEQVGQQHVGGPLARQPQRFLAVAREGDVISGLLQHDSHRVAHVRVVVDDENKLRNR